MIVKLIIFEATSYYKTPVFRVIGANGFPLRTLSEDEIISSYFLCLTKDKQAFVSCIAYTESLGYYVDNVRRKVCVPILELKEIQLIEM